MFCEVLILIVANTTVATFKIMCTKQQARYKFEEGFYEFPLDEICFLRKEIVLTNDIIKSLLIVESTSRDRPHFFYKV